MRTLTKIIITLSIAIATSIAAHAQFYELVSHGTDMLKPVLQGGQNYRGFVEVSYLKGLGDKQANFLELSTTQGFKYRDWFFFGVGAGIDWMKTTANDGGYRPSATSTNNTNCTNSAAMVPLFTDFRFNIGDISGTSFFIDLRVGAGFYIADKYIIVGDGYINTSESFYLKPSMGLRIPVSSTDSKYAINVGASYQLLTNSYWYSPGPSNSIALSSMGVNVSFEW